MTVFWVNQVANIFSLILDLNIFSYLGGFGKVSPADIRDSNKFFDELAVLRPDLKFDIAAGSALQYRHCDRHCSH